MSTMIILLAINLPYIPAVFIIWKIWRYSPRLLLLFIALTSSAECARLLTSTNRSYEQIGTFVKFLCEWPLGFGSIVAFPLLPNAVQRKCLPAFTRYINAAVLANIGMMFFIPAEGTLRGQLHKPLCLLLLSWLIRECRKVHWRTVQFDNDGLFIFVASPLPWIICHAMYRVAMMTLPIFDTGRYLVMELLSLGTMLLLARRAKVRTWHGVACRFGLADTMVISTIVCVSAGMRAAGIGVPVIAADDGILDTVVCPLQVLAAAVCIRYLRSGSSSMSLSQAYRGNRGERT